MGAPINRRTDSLRQHVVHPRFGLRFDVTPFGEVSKSGSPPHSENRFYNDLSRE